MSSIWTEHRAPEGRLYWFNTQTRASVWERPDELKSPAERALASTPWKEYQTPEGRKYWHHTQTKETVWTLPPEVKEAVDKAVAAAGGSTTPQPNGSSTPVPPGSAPGFGAPAFVPAAGLPARPAFAAIGSTMLPTSNAPIPEFRTTEEAEEAYVDMLREKGVTSSWTWEQTMRHIITEPLYKALDTMAARKAAFEKYVEEEKTREKEQRAKNISKARSGFRSGLDRLGDKPGPDGRPGPGVKSWWTFERMQKEVEARAPEIWKLSKNDDERRTLWTEYIDDFRERETSAAAKLRSRQQEKLAALLRDPERLGLGPNLENVQWRQGHAIIVRSSAMREDEDLRQMEDLDILLGFEEQVKRAEREANEIRQKDKEARRRAGRKARAAYASLLQELKSSGQIRAGTMWKDVYPSIENDERYTNLLGLEGSSPLDLFWDAVDELDQKIEDLQRIVENVLAGQGKKVEEETELDDFRGWMRGAKPLTGVPDRELKLVFLNMQARAARTGREERRRAEKKLRNLTEDLRYALKKISPPVELDTPYDKAISRFADLPEFVALEGNDDARKEAYGRYMDRLKDKAEDKKSRRREDDARRTSKAKESLAGWSDDEGSVASAPKKRRKDHDGLADGADSGGDARHSSPRSSRRDEERSSRHHRSSRQDDDRERDRERDDRDRSRPDRGDRDRDRDRDRERDDRRRDKDRRLSRYDDDVAAEPKKRDDRDKRGRTDSHGPSDVKPRESKRLKTSSAAEKEDGEEGELDG